METIQRRMARRRAVASVESFGDSACEMTDPPVIRFLFLDASAMVKLVVDEPGADAVRSAFSGLHSFCSTSFCVAEALSALKTKWRRKEITIDQYGESAYLLMAYVRDRRIRLSAKALEEYSVFTETETLAKKHNVDLSDALQLHTLNTGLFKVLLGESRPILVTADSDLATAAQAEGLQVWNCFKDPMPSPALSAAPEPPPAVAVQAVADNMNHEPERDAPADDWGR